MVEKQTNNKNKEEGRWVLFKAKTEYNKKRTHYELYKTTKLQQTAPVHSVSKQKI